MFSLLRESKDLGFSTQQMFVKHYENTESHFTDYYRLFAVVFTVADSSPCSVILFIYLYQGGLV